MIPKYEVCITSSPDLVAQGFVCRIPRIPIRTSQRSQYPCTLFEVSQNMVSARQRGRFVLFPIHSFVEGAQTLMTGHLEGAKHCHFSNYSLVPAFVSGNLLHWNVLVVLSTPLTRQDK